MLTITCYGQSETWPTRESALAFYTEAALATEGAESERYENICEQIKAGLLVCSDEE